jgi:uncharacterized integral membrane protein (TIGR00698 family)
MHLVRGIVLALTIAAAAFGVAALERRIVGAVVIDALVVAILLGVLVRAVWTPGERIEAGVNFAAKELLELAVMLLGASVELPLLLRAGPALAIGIVALVMLGMVASRVIGRAFGLPPKLAILIAAGNSICGNSAIAALAPVIGAEKEHVASAIAFTAALGVAVVLALPLLIAPLALSDYQYGALAGLTVYAVPQVLAATFPVSAVSAQVGTLVKLVRVLMLGPIVMFYTLRVRRARTDAGEPGRLEGTRFVPWFIIGFVVLAILRSIGAIPTALLDPVRTATSVLTIVAMAALGLGVDLRSLGRVGRPVMLTVTASLVVLVGLAVLLIRLLGIR